MANTNWRYVVTWWYMDENWNIIEETQRVPDVTHSPDHIMSQIDSLLSWEKTAAQIRAEDWIYWTNGSSYRRWSSVLPQGYQWPSDADIDALIQAASGGNRTSSTFSPAEAYAMQAQWYADQWDTAMASAFGDIAKNMWAYSNFANQSLWAADSLINYIRSNETWLQNVAWNLYSQLVGDINNQRNYINQMFGPNGELTQEVNKYYDDLGNYLATDAWHEAAKIAAQWMHTWASLWAIRAQQNEAYNQSFQRYIQAKEQQINAKQQIASNLINYMSQLRQEYGDTTNQYIIELYKRAADLYETVASSAANDLRDWNVLRAKWLWSGSSSSSNSTTSTLDSLVSYRNQLASQWVDVTDIDKQIQQLYSLATLGFETQV